MVRTHPTDSGNLVVDDLTVNNDLTVSNDLTVNGDLNFGDAVTDTFTAEGVVIIDNDNAEAFLVRKDGDAGDVLVVDNSSTGQVLLADGSVGVPALSFISDTDSGFYFDSTRLTVAIAGAEIADFRANGFVINTAITMGSNQFSWGGTEEDGGLLFKSGLGNAIHILGDDTGNSFVFTTYDNRTSNHDHGNRTDPTISVHSATDPDTDNTEYFRMFFDSTLTKAVIETDGSQRMDLNASQLNLMPGTKSDGKIFRKAVEVQTTDATLTTVDTIALEDENTYIITAELVGVKSDGSDRAGYRAKGLFYRTAAGSADQVGSTFFDQAIESDAAWGGLSFAVSGNNVLVQCTGKAATTIEWGTVVQAFNMSN